MGVEMLALLTFVALAGAVLGLRFKAFALVPLIVLVGLGIIANGAGTDQGSRAILLTLLAAVACLQIGYFAVCILRAYLQVGATSRRPDLFQALRTAIGEELKSSFALPEELTPEMLALLKQMN
jgi:hypothetical protein